MAEIFDLQSFRTSYIKSIVIMLQNNFRSYCKNSNCSLKPNKLKLREILIRFKHISQIALVENFEEVTLLAESVYSYLSCAYERKINIFESDLNWLIEYVLKTLKMLLRNKKPKDFDLLIQYLKDPQKYSYLLN